MLRDHSAIDFRFPGGGHAVVLIHGLTGTPSEMKPLGRGLGSLRSSAVAPAIT